MVENLIIEAHRPGRIEVICGSMFSGKTEELIRRMKRAKFAKQRVEIFKPAIDTRYSEEDVVSHVPFGPIPALCAIADEVTKVHAICVRCGALAYVSHRLVQNEHRVMLGEETEYEPLCRDCYQKALKEERNQE